MKLLLKDLFTFVIFVAVLIFIYAVVSFTVGVVFSAPAPLTRKQDSVPSPFIGQWNLTFYGTEYSIHLYSNGSYTAVDKENNRWIGKWYHRDGWIFVTEYRTYQHGIYVEKGNSYTWSVMVNSNSSIRIWRKVL